MMNRAWQQLLLVHQHMRWHMLQHVDKGLTNASVDAKQKLQGLPSCPAAELGPASKPSGRPIADNGEAECSERVSKPQC